MYTYICIFTTSTDIPYDFSLWQVDDSKGHNRSFKMSMAKGKKLLSEKKEK